MSVHMVHFTLPPQFIGLFFIVIAGNDNDDGRSWSWYDHIIYENFSRGRSISQRAEARQVRTVFKISQLKISLNVIVPQAESHNLHWRMLSFSLLYLDMFVNIKWSVEWAHTTGRRERRATPGDGVQYLRGILLLQPEFQRQQLESEKETDLMPCSTWSLVFSPVSTLLTLKVT